LGDAPIFIALDEAQGLAHLYKEYFLSAAESAAKPSPRKPRPVIRKLVEVWSLHIRNIISGTGLSMESVEQALKSVVAKIDARMETFIDLGAFESNVDQLTYIQHYLPPHFLTHTFQRIICNITGGK
jgi:hypothetical protein